MDLFDAQRVVFVHAHPDDETIQTGALIASLLHAGVAVHVLTATRGERGELRPAIDPDADVASLRAQEWRDALAALGVEEHEFLGAGPARARGRDDRRYSDSGMEWVDESQSLAGPAGDAGDDSLSLADADEIAADIACYAKAVEADALVTYDEHGGYGHPDHVALHVPTRAAARKLGVACFEVVSDGLDVEGATRHDASAELESVRAALGAYASQLEVDGDDIVHVGGQRMPIPLVVHTRRVE